ncbi:MAG: type III polyketide synthase, partial [Rhizobiaceae bacterium]|nr:type III polyketide synthase [Rhizobiaceae bacterium]
IVMISSTGVATPTVDARAMQVMGFRADVSRVPVFGLGCAAGVTGMAIAAKLARAQPGSTILMVAIELCSLSFNAKNPSKADFVATVLFGDGAAALCVRSKPCASAGEITIGEGIEHLWLDTLDNMGWDVKASGFGVILDKSIPNFVRERYRDAANTALRTAGFKRHDIERFICHPGSVKVIQAIEASLELPNGTLDHERAIMSDYGNMSAPTVLFILERVMKEARPGQYMMASLGPGFTASFLPVKFHG